MTFCHGLKLTASDGKQRKTDCANTEGLFRIIQSIPSPKAEPFKRWLAQVGYERVKEIENPELASATFGVTPGEHSQFKGLDEVKTGNNLRDHMTHLELIFTMLGEAKNTYSQKAVQERVGRGNNAPP
ncbi:BRO N-terminal domain containing protein [Burkholderiaceae bacterium]